MATSELEDVQCARQPWREKVCDSTRRARMPDQGSDSNGRLDLISLGGSHMEMDNREWIGQDILGVSQVLRRTAEEDSGWEPTRGDGHKDTSLLKRL